MCKRKLVYMCHLNNGANENEIMIESVASTAHLGKYDKIVAYFFFGQNYRTIWEYNELFQDLVDLYFWNYSSQGSSKASKTRVLWNCEVGAIL